MSRTRTPFACVSASKWIKRDYSLCKQSIFVVLWHQGERGRFVAQRYRPCNLHRVYIGEPR